MTSTVMLTLLLQAASAGSDWPQWRGPNFDGSSDETSLPTRWSKTENIAWAADLPGESSATPIVCGDFVFVSTTNEVDDTLLALCLDRKTGARIWSDVVAKGIRKDSRSTFSAPSPASNGNVVIFFFGNHAGDMVAYDYSGKRLWTRQIGPFAFGWTFSTSPVLYDGKLYMQVLQRDVAVEGRGLTDQLNLSYLLALDPATGKEVWKRDRPSQAVVESREAFTTPTPFERDGRRELLVVGGDALTGHDPQTGEELWRWGTWNPGREPFWRLVTSAVGGGGIILVCAPKGQPVYAIRTGGAGMLGDDAVAWVGDGTPALSSDVPTPAFDDGDFFVLNDKARRLTRVEPGTGRVKWAVETPGRAKYEASPLVADGKVYIVNFDGLVTVVAEKDGSILAEIEMGPDERTAEVVRSSIVAAHGQLFVRAPRTLYCIGR